MRVWTRLRGEDDPDAPPPQTGDRDDEPTTTTSARRWTLWAAVLVGLLTFAGHCVSPSVTSADSVRFVPVAESLVSDQTFAIDWSQDLPNGGKANSGMYRNPADITDPVYPYYPLGPALLAVPVIAVVHVTKALGLTPSVRKELRQNGTWRLERLIGSVEMGLTAAILFLVALSVLNRSPARRTGRRDLALAAVAALTFAYATPAWTTGSRALWQHGPSMLVFSLALLICVRARRNARLVIWLGPVMGFAYVIRPTSGVAVAAFTVWVAICHRRRLIPYLAGVGVVLGGLALVNLHLYDSPLSPYYRPGRQGTNPDIAEALAGNLVSPGRGIFASSPILLLAFVGLAFTLLRRRFDVLDGIVWFTIATHWIVISVTAPQWWGGYTIGPRLFSDVVPLLWFAALPVLEPWPRLPAPRAVKIAGTAAAAIMLVFSFVVSAEGAFMKSVWCWNHLHDIDNRPYRVWAFRHGQLFAGVNALKEGSTWREETEPGAATTSACIAPQPATNTRGS